MTTLTAKYVTLRTLSNNHFDSSELVAWMADFGYQVRANVAQEVFEIVQPVNEEYEVEEVVDYAHPIVVFLNGEKYYDIYLAEMETTWTFDGQDFCTIMDDVEFQNYPMMIRRELNK